MSLWQKKTNTNILTKAGLNENYINGLSQTKSFWQLAILASKMMHRHNFESTLTISLKNIAQWKGPRGTWELY